MSFDAGVMSSGPAIDLERAMRSNGLGDTTPGFFGPPTPQPNSFRGLPFALDVEYRTQGPWTVSLNLGSATVSQTHGYHAPVQFLRLEYAVSSIGMLVSRFHRGFRVGVGPAWYAVHVKQAADVAASERHPQWGILSQVGMRIPERSRIYFDVGFHYHYVGSVTLGPYAPVPTADTPAIFPATNVRFDRWFLGFGPGIRLL